MLKFQLSADDPPSQHQVDSSLADTVTMDTRYWFPSVTEWYANLDKRNAATVIVLVYCNLINYMDRSTVAGLLDYIGNDEDFNKPDLKKQGKL